jgi:transposase-like protein
MSRQRKTAAVLRLLRGEDLETVSRELGVTAATLTGWHDAFLAAGEAYPSDGRRREHQFHRRDGSYGMQDPVRFNSV